MKLTKKTAAASLSCSTSVNVGQTVWRLFIWAIGGSWIGRSRIRLKKILNRFKSGKLGILLLLALATVVVHALTNNRYGFHRDELATLGVAQHLDWGYGAYPPVTPFIARLSLTLFGPSLVGLRFFSSLAISSAMVFAGLMVRELGGSHRRQITAALAVGIAPI